MPTNLSLLLNILLLISVIGILVYVFRKKHEFILPMDQSKPALTVSYSANDDIIAVRKIAVTEEAADTNSQTLSEPSPASEASQKKRKVTPINTSTTSTPLQKTLMLFLLAKPKRHLAGYEMLQSILAADLRFGEQQLFHRHQFENGQGPIVCSLASATETGVFDLQNIGAFNAKGLCLFMHLSGNADDDQLRLDKMIETAQQLAESLDTLLLDDKRRPFSEQAKTHYYQRLSTLS